MPRMTTRESHSYNGLPTRPGWGTELDEKAVRAHAWSG